MIFCFDMDGTLTKAPKVLGEIMKSLKKSGHTVYILTGSLGETPPDKLQEYRLAQAKSLGLLIGESFDDIVSCVHPSFEGVANLKGKFCKQEKVDFMIDDMALYIQSIRQYSPETFIAAVV
jgi:hypothetical protein